MAFTESLIPIGEQLRSASDHWCFAKDGDDLGFQLYRRHYSSKKSHPKIQQFVGPGRKLVLLSHDGKALWAWRRFIDDTEPKQTGWNCAIFRNEGHTLSSSLIREAVDVLFRIEGRSRCYTLVNPAMIRSRNPGCCFKKAGWKCCAISKTGKVILEYGP